MKEGDLIEWKGMNKTIRGTVVRNASGDFVCRLDDGKTFPLRDIRRAKSAKLIET